MKVKAVKSFVSKHACATKGQVFEIENEKAKKLIELKVVEKTTESPQPPQPPAGDDE